jgi:hypothetical protein
VMYPGVILFRSTYFVIPDGCIVLIQFYFDVLVFVCLFCLCNNAEFYILLTVHLDVILANDQLDYFLMYLFHASTCFEHKCSSSGGPNCINASSGMTHSGG